MVGRIPELADTEFTTVKAWFAIVAPLVGGWHADDDVSDLAFTPEEAKQVKATMTRIFRGRANWPDPDFIYALAGYGTFEIEKLYPGIELDVSTAANRLGFTCIAGRELPNLVTEDANQYVIVEFPERIGPISAHTDFIMKSATVPHGWNYDAEEVVVDESSAIRFDDLSMIDNLILRVAGHDDFVDDEEGYSTPGY